MYLKPTIDQVIFLGHICSKGAADRMSDTDVRITDVLNRRKGFGYGGILIRLAFRG